MSIPDHDMAIMACAPTRPQDYDDMRRKMWNDALAAGLPVPPAYPGRIFKRCQMCDIEVQVGPRQQEMLETLDPDKVWICCLICSVIVTVQEHDVTDGESQTTVHNLGNPYEQKERS